MQDADGGLLESTLVCPGTGASAGVPGAAADGQTEQAAAAAAASGHSKPQDGINKPTVVALLFLTFVCFSSLMLNEFCCLSYTIPCKT